jgi:type VI secretion system secreted protein Hcp
LEKRIVLWELVVFVVLSFAVSGMLYSMDRNSTTQQKVQQKRRAEIILRPIIDSVYPQKVVLSPGGEAVIIEVRGSYLAIIGSIRVTRAGVEAQGVEEVLDQSQLPAVLKVSLQASGQAEVASDYLLTVFDANQNKLLDIPNAILAIESQVYTREAAPAREAPSKEGLPSATKLNVASPPVPPAPPPPPPPQAISAMSSMSFAQAMQVKGGTFQAFLRIDGIQGDSTDPQHPNEIELKTFGWGGSNAIEKTSTAFGVSGQAVVQPFTFTMLVNRASPKLFRALATGEHIKDAVLTVRNSAGHEYLILRFDYIVVASYKTAADTSQDILPIDEVAISFAVIEMSFIPLMMGGTSGAPIKVRWDSLHNMLY